MPVVLHLVEPNASYLAARAPRSTLARTDLRPLTLPSPPPGGEGTTRLPLPPPGGEGTTRLPLPPSGTRESTRLPLPPSGTRESTRLPLPRGGGGLGGGGRMSSRQIQARQREDANGDDQPLAAPYRLSASFAARAA